MNIAIYVLVKFERNINIREIKCIQFLFEKDIIIEYEPLIESFIKVDDTLRRFRVDNHHFPFTRIEKPKDKEEYLIRVSRKGFLKMLYYCASHMSYDAALKEKDELDLLYEVLQKLIE